MTEGFHHDEEEMIQAERDAARAPKVLDQRAFKQPIRCLNPRPAVTIERGKSVRDAVEEMKKHNVGVILVLEDGHPAGIVTERDIVRKALGGDPAATRVETIMTPDPHCLRMEDQIVYALNHMSVGGYRHIPLVDASGKVTHVLSIRDLLQYIVDFYPHDVLNLPPKPPSGAPPRPEGG